MPLQSHSQLCKLVGILEQRLTGAVQFHGGEAELFGDVRVLDGQGFLHLRGIHETITVLVML